MRNKNFIIKAGTLGAAIMDAQMKVGNPPFKVPPQYHKLYWENAAEEQRQDSKLLWVSFEGKPEYALLPCTNEEKELRGRAEQWKLKVMFEYILNSYGWEIAMRFYADSSWTKKFKEHNVKIDTQIPCCYFSEDCQCNFLCKYYKGGKCCYD